MSFNIIGSGSGLPEKIITNDELSKFVDTSDEWIAQRVGVRERRVCVTETTATMAHVAAQNALDSAGLSAESLDLIIVANVSGDDVCPSVACAVQGLLGATCPAFDQNAACSGYIYMLETAAAYFALGKAKHILVIGSERMTRLVDWHDRNTCVIFGDGAGATLLEPGDGYIASKLVAIGGDSVLKIPASVGNSPFFKGPALPPYLIMNGRETFRFAVNAMCRDVNDVIAEAGLTSADIAFFLPHQANMRIIETAAKKLGISGERVLTNIQKYGNTSAASIPLLLDELLRSGRASPGDHIAMCSFGGGLTSAACVIRL